MATPILLALPASTLVASVLAAVFGLSCVVLFVWAILGRRRQAAELRALRKELGTLKQERDLLRTDLSEAQKHRTRADEANQAKSLFLSTISHEIRTPLNAVLGLSQVLQTTDLTKEQRECLDGIRNSGDLLLAIISNILDFSKLESGALELKPEQFEFGELVEEVYGLYRHTARQKGIRFECRMSTERSLLVRADRTYLRQTLVNILAHGFKTTDQGDISLSVSWESVKDPPPDGKPGATYSKVTIIHRDTGSGFPAGKELELFNPFSRLELNSSLRYSSSSLGLSIVKRVIDTMKGTIVPERLKPSGTGFTVNLLLETIQVQSTGKSSKSGPSLYKNALSETFYSHRILVAEDDPNNRMVVNLMLKKMGHKVFLVDNGALAVEFLRDHEIDLILMDIDMPVLDGIQATRKIREGEAGEDRKSVPIVALTAFAVTADREKFLAAGMDFYLSKPVKPESLRDVFTQIAREKSDGR